jgi:hypothetical protein
VESAFVGFSIKSIFAESSEHLSDMFAVKFFIVRVDEDVVKVGDHANIEHVGEDVIHESLKSSWRIGESKGMPCHSNDP